MGYKCERCQHEWIPRMDVEVQPKVCPKCHSPYWDSPRRSMMTYEDFRDKIKKTLVSSSKPLTWTEVRTIAKLPQAFPNNQWVHRMEKDLGLERKKDSHGIIQWSIK
jgi:hypothetical protein